MRLLDFIKRNKLFSTFIVVVLILLGEIGYTYYITSKSNQKEPNGLNGYNELYKKVVDIQNTQLSKNSEYFRAIKYLAKTKSESSKNQEYSDLSISFSFIESVYARTNIHEFYSLAKDYDTFAKANFSNLYKTNDFFIPCMDTACADSPQPQEIISIINEINGSTVPDLIKKSFVQNLTNITYISKTQAHLKTDGYLIVAAAIENSGSFKRLGLNTKLANEIIDFLKKEYPKEYQKITSKQSNN